MQIKSIEHGDDVTRVALEGRLDTLGVDAIETRFNAAILPRSRDTIVDLSAVSFLSSMGVRMLLVAAKALQRKGARLVLVTAGRQLIDEALRHSAVDQLLPVASDAGAATALLAR